MLFKLLSNFFRTDRTRESEPARMPDSGFETYEQRPPSPQNTIDCVSGWHTKFPDSVGVSAGDLALFEDVRLNWAIQQFGMLEGKAVLELGPLEGAHTFKLTSCGAQVDAVEANKNAFLRCLITKEITNMHHARFLLGDFVSFLENDRSKTWDFIVACGVLYHMRDPAKVLDLICQRTNALYLWTYFVDMSILGDTDRSNWNKVAETVSFNGAKITMYRRSYAGSNESPAFCGGIFDNHRWMSREGIFQILEQHGFTEIQINHESPYGEFGSSASIFARR